MITAFLSRSLMPGLGIIAALVLAHQWWLEHESRTMAAGKMQCDSGWELAITKKQLDGARKDIERHKEIAAVERAGAQELFDENQRIKTSYERELAAASSDPSCLSDSVRDTLRKRFGVGPAR